MAGRGRERECWEKDDPQAVCVGGRDGGPMAGRAWIWISDGGAEGTPFGDPVSFTLVPDMGLLLACCGCRDYVTFDAMSRGVTNATSSTWPRDRCTANFAAESSFPGFALLIPRPIADSAHDGLFLLPPRRYAWHPLPSLCQPASPGHKGQVHHQQRSQGLHVSRARTSSPRPHPSAAPSTNTPSMASGS